MATPSTSPHRIGYARVSSVGQNLDSQLDALQQAGCGKIFTDQMTGSRMDRPGWDRMMDYVRPGDTVVVTELSRMTRSLLDLLETTKTLEKRRVNLVSLRENIDTTGATGRCFLSMMGKPGEEPVGDHELTPRSWRTRESCTRTRTRPLMRYARW